MKKATILLAIIFCLSIAGGTYANYIQKTIKIIWYRLSLSDALCNHSIPADEITSTEDFEDAVRIAYGTVALAQPPASACTITIYFLPE